MCFRKVGDHIDYSGGLYEERYETFEQAKEGHARACRYIHCIVLA
jgi:hypothetical protein